MGSKNWVIRILPFMEEGTLLNKFNFKYGSTTTTPYRAHPNGAATASELPIMLCPSDTFNREPHRANHNPNAFGVPIYQAYAGQLRRQRLPHAGEHLQPNQLLGHVSLRHTRAVGLVQTTSWRTRGIMGAGDSVGAKKITDGLSNTVLMFELRAGLASVDWRGTWANGAAAASSVWFHYEGSINGGKDNCNVPEAALYAALGAGNATLGKKIVAQEGMGVFGGGNHQGMPRSMHLGGVHACIADGSVRFISDFIDAATAMLIASSRLAPMATAATRTTTR